MTDTATPALRVLTGTRHLAPSSVSGGVLLLRAAFGRSRRWVTWTGGLAVLALVGGLAHSLTRAASHDDGGS